MIKYHTAPRHMLRHVSLFIIICKQHLHRNIYMKVQVKCPINIALMKYWGKRDEANMLPLNDSLSLPIDALYADTSIEVQEVEDAGEHIVDVVVVNSITRQVSPGTRYALLFDKLRQILVSENKSQVALPFSLRVDSATNFPDSSGLASSAAGFAAIAKGLGELFGLSQKQQLELARTGSGSATRSLLPGFVLWRRDDGGCETLFPPDHWPSLRAVVVAVHAGPKAVSSTAGMKLSALTSDLLQYRVSHSAPKRLLAMKTAIDSRDFAAFGQLVMADSNQLHAICMDTYPPLFYLNDTSRKIIDLVHEFNSSQSSRGGEMGVKVAYTFDAGPHATLFMQADTVDTFLDTFVEAFGPVPIRTEGGSDACNGNVAHNHIAFVAVSTVTGLL